MHKNISNGFTLVETLVVAGLFTLLSLVIGLSIVNLYQSNSYTIAQSYEVDHARQGLQAWLSDAREMVYADDGTFPIAVTAPHRFGFYSDIDKDMATEYTLFELATTTLFKYTYEATGTPPVYNLVTPTKTEILSEYVQNQLQATSTFKYYDTDGNQITATSSLLTDIRYIEMQVVVNIDPLRSPGEFLLRGGVAPRNLKDNL
jgi:type II secretory pathway pseudopilin PulG